MDLKQSLTDVAGIRVGHVTNLDALTGCTVILCDSGTIGGVDQRGGAPGTRELDLLRPMHLVQHVNGIVLSGGSAFGLDAASGVMRYLEEQKQGVNTGAAIVPIVPAAVIYDLAIGRADIRPGAEMGYQACLNASAQPCAEGNVGAGTGATVGKILGMTQAMKTGLGCASMEIGSGVVVSALMVVNAVGDVIDPSNGQIIAGVRSAGIGPIRIGGAPGTFADTLQIMRSLVGKAALEFSSRANTVIGVVATNARLTKEETNKVAQMAHNGLARTIRPAHTMMDGDTIFALATGKRSADVNAVGAFAAEVVAQAIVRAVRAAQPAGGLPAAS